MTGSSFRKLIIKSSQLDMPNSALRGRHLIVGRLASGELKASSGTLENARCINKSKWFL